MEFKDNVKVPTGWLTICAYDGRGRLIDKMEGENIVVNYGREALARLLGGHDPVADAAALVGTPYEGIETWVVNTMGFGKGGHDAGDPLIMEAVSVTDTALYDETVNHPRVEAVATWSAGDRKVTFTAEVDTTEGNGTGTLEYSEAGLFFGDTTGGDSDVLFAHKAFGYIVKNNTIKLVATWTFTF